MSASRGASVCNCFLASFVSDDIYEAVMKSDIFVVTLASDTLSVSRETESMHSSQDERGVFITPPDVSQRREQ